ncbi:zinc-dependent peptidase [Aquabacterium sp.]|uniref:M90 family metallopeptidase n=1 Tax=Aquabacterium sp. TaxID=1872578 RepID=UPI002BD3B326|nr:M90 family metallopeptidase [Aquabacterium sp.]HSW07165.1 M90 family metallopeptidase [Aquabacterium sp.]
MLIVAGLVLLMLGWWLTHTWRGERRRARWQAAPFPATWRRILRRRVPLVARLPVPLQLRLKGLIQAFLAEVPIIGCGGLTVSDEMRVTIAAQACLLLLGRHRGGTPVSHFPNLRQVLLYPGAFVVERAAPQAGGVLQEQRRTLAGESWQQGQVILSWDAVRDGAALPDDGQNVVLHEFAHQLDQETGAANGAPLMPGTAHLRQWAAVFSTAFAELQQRLQQGEPGCLGPYAASSEAEFFAVATEVFFEQPRALRQEYPALHDVLTAYYGLQPEGW